VIGDKRSDNISKAQHNQIASSASAPNQTTINAHANAMSGSPSGHANPWAAFHSHTAAARTNANAK
jgi:hypothetical protein